MVEGSKPTRYSVRLKRNLPQCESPPLELDCNAGEVAALCRKLVNNADAVPLGGSVNDIEACLTAMHAVDFLNSVKRSSGLSTHHVEQLFGSRPNARSGPIHGNTGRARGYQRGDHLPHDSSILKLEKQLGAKLRDDFYQLLWLSLDTRWPIGELALDWINSLHWYSAENLHYTLWALDQSSLLAGKFQMLEGANKRACTRTLAGLIVLLRYAVEKKLDEVIQRAPIVIFHCLLVLGPELEQRGIASTLYRFCLKHILPLGERQFLDHPSTMARMSAVLNLLALLNVENPDLPITWPERSHTMFHILSGKFGDELKTYFAPGLQEYESDFCERRKAAWTFLFRFGSAKIFFRSSEETRCLDLPSLCEFEPLLPAWGEATFTREGTEKSWADALLRRSSGNAADRMGNRRGTRTDFDRGSRGNRC